MQRSEVGHFIPVATLLDKKSKKSHWDINFPGGIVKNCIFQVHEYAQNPKLLLLSIVAQLKARTAAKILSQFSNIDRSLAYSIADANLSFGETGIMNCYAVCNAPHDAAVSDAVTIRILASFLGSDKIEWSDPKIVKRYGRIENVKKNTLTRRMVRSESTDQIIKIYERSVDFVLPYLNTYNEGRKAYKIKKSL